MGLRWDTQRAPAKGHLIVSGNRSTAPARGDGSGRTGRRVAIAFEEAQFGQIRSLAITNKISFGAQVRRLVADALTPLK